MDKIRGKIGERLLEYDLSLKLILKFEKNMWRGLLQL